MAPPRQRRGCFMPMLPIRHRRHLGIEMCEQVLKEEPTHFDPPFGIVAYSVPPPFPTQAEREKLIEGEINIKMVQKFNVQFSGEKKGCRSRKLSRKATRGHSIAVELFG